MNGLKIEGADDGPLCLSRFAKDPSLQSGEEEITVASP